MTRTARVLVLMLALPPIGGCGAMRNSNPRFVRHQVAISRWCDLTTIRDLRTDLCWVAYDCKWSPGLTGLIQAPKEVCQP